MKGKGDSSKKGERIGSEDGKKKWKRKKGT